MKTSRRTVWAVLALAVFLMLTIWATGRLAVGYRTPLTCCAVDPGTGGGLAVARWARLLGYPVRRLRDPVWEATESFASPTGNCILTAGNDNWSPWGRAMEPRDARQLIGWLERGNVLIVMTARPDRLPEPLLRQLGRKEPPDKFQIDLGETLDTTSDSESVRTRDGDTLVVREDGPRWSDVPQQGQIAHDERGSVLQRYAFGDGALYLLLDDLAWSNEGFDQGENARVLANILQSELQEGVLAFDEYRHGHGRVESLMTYALSLPGARTFVLVGLILAGFYVYGRNRRFGPPEPFLQPERRTAAEYIDSVAYLYERARAAPLVVQAVVQRLRFLEQHRGRHDPELQQLLERVERDAGDNERPAHSSHWERTVSQLVRWGKERYGS